MTKTHPIFYLQIVDADGQIAHLPGGGPLELNLIDLVTKAILAKGVGLFRTSSHVEQDIKDGLTEILMGLKQQTVHLV